GESRNGAGEVRANRRERQRWNPCWPTPCVRIWHRMVLSTGIPQRRAKPPCCCRWTDTPVPANGTTCAPIPGLTGCPIGPRLPLSALRDQRRKLTFVPAGHEYYDCQDPHILTRVAYFYFDPTELAIDPELGFAEMAPRLFFENAALWSTALKLMSLVEHSLSANRLYFDALGAVLAHELVRLNTGAPSSVPPVRGGLAAWQQRI